MTDKNQTSLTKYEDTARSFLLSVSKSIEKSKLSDYNFNNFMRSAVLAISENDVLIEATQTQSGQQQLFDCLRRAAVSGLSLAQADGESCLIGYKNKNTGEISVSYQVMKGGMIKLAMRSGEVNFVKADIVRENDNFSVTSTMDGDKYEFTPALKDRGEPIGYFCAVKLKNGESVVKYVTIGEALQHRDKYARSVKDGSSWAKSFDAMALKTVVKMLFRNLYISDEMNSTMSDDEINIINVTDKKQDDII